MAREGITRKTVDLTHAQVAVVEEMIRQMSERASDAAGVPIRISTRQFFHMLLKQHAATLDLDWPDDYPQPGGYRGGAKSPKE